jgi:uncharacterized membrane protein YqhA
MKLVRVVTATRYLILLPVVGLALASAVLFAFGGIGLVTFLVRNAGLVAEGHDLTVLPIFDLLQYVHQFLIGTVLYITAMGFYQLFIQDVPVPDWMKVESAEDLETNLVGVIIVVLSIEFLGAVFSGSETNLLQYGAGVALPIAALALFLGVRHRLHTRREGRGSIGPHSFGEAQAHKRTDGKDASSQVAHASDATHTEGH